MTDFSNIIGSELNNILDSKEVQERFTRAVLGDNIARAWLRKYPAYHDIINTFDDSLNHIENIVSVQSSVDKNIHTPFPNIIIHFKFWVTNVRIFSPNTPEHKLYSQKIFKVSSPNQALKERKTYALLLLGDANYSYTVINVKKIDEAKTYTKTLPDKWQINLPMPIGSKYCVLRKYDPLTLIKSGEDMDGLYGMFIINGFVKFLISCYQKPFNSPMIQHNTYDNQLSRCEVLYSAGLDYENSYYIIASMIRPRAAHIGRGVNQIPIVDFIFSLQMNDSVMNQEVIIGRKKSLINAVPIKYLFWAFDCKTDYEMLQYICPDMNDFGLIHAIRQACLEGDAHINAIKNLLDFNLSRGFLYFNKKLTRQDARYVIGNLILSADYKQQARDKSNNNIGIYRTEIIRQVDRLLRTKFMPGIGRLDSDQSLYTIDANKLTPSQREKMDKEEQIRNKAICFEIGNIIRDLYRIGNDIVPSMDKISLLNRRVRGGQLIEIEFKKFNNVRMREIEVRIDDTINKNAKSVTALESDEFLQLLENKMLQLVQQLNLNQSSSLLNAFKGIQTREKSKIKTDLLDFKNQAFVYAKLREIVISTDAKAAGSMVLWEHRAVHPSHMYFIDPVFSPEGGHQVGRYQQLTLYTYLTLGDLGKSIITFIRKNKNYQQYSKTIDNKYIIKLNGSTIGYINQFEPVEELYQSLLEARRTGEIVKDCSITLKHFEGILSIWSDGGRIMTPFIEVKNCFEYAGGKIGIKANFISWLEDCGSNFNPNNNDPIEKGLKHGFITLYDPEMTAYNITVAETVEDYFKAPWKYSHIALPSHILSYVMTCSPALSLNAAIRGSYSSNHLKQAAGIITRYPQIKYIGDCNVLLNPQLPIVRTGMYDMLKFNEKPMGNNLILAFMIYSDNQEDSFIFNRSSVENGVLVIDTYTVKFAQQTVQDEKFQIPDETTKKLGNPESYLRLDPKSCLPRNVGDKFYENDVIIAKITQMKNNDVKKTDRSILNEKPDACHPREANTREMRCVSKDVDIDNNKSMKMAVLGQRRCAISGDKFNSTNAQKGTVGRIYNSDQMPYTSNGIKPDIIFNPPSIFKRNTCGQTYEGVIGKLAALLGCPIDCTPYETIRSIEELEEIYKKLGLDPMGYEDLYDPQSGRKMGKVFLGILHYQRQQHLVEDKLNVRCGEGDVDRVTGLPVKGRKRSGGQSMDRMSWDSYNSAGCMNLNRDLHLNQGAKLEIAICNKCHHQYTYKSKTSNCWICNKCGRHSDFIIKEVVPTENLISQILTGMHICLEYRSVNKDDKEHDILEDADDYIN